MPIWAIILMVFLYGAFEFIGSILFNWRLMLTSEKKFTKAGIFASISTVMFVSSVVIASWIGTSGENTAWWMVPGVAISMGIGNYLAALSVPKIRCWLSRNDVKVKDE